MFFTLVCMLFKLLFIILLILCSTTYIAVPRNSDFRILPLYINKMASDRKAGESGEALATDLRFSFA